MGKFGARWYSSVYGCPGAVIVNFWEEVKNW